MATRYKRAGARRETVEQLLRGFRVEYRCPADAQHTALPDASVDFVCSSNVLEHIPPRVLQNIHRETCRILKPRGLAVHRVNPGDHFTAIDPSITEANFLRYSAKEWRRYSGSPLAYHNRLRCIQHRRLIEESGFSILVDRVRTSQRALEAIRSGRLPIHPSFAQFEAEQLAADYLWIVGERRAMRSLHQRVA